MWAVQMPFLVVRMRRLKSGAYSARKVIPAGVRGEYARLYGPRWEAKFSLQASTKPREAKTKEIEWLATVETQIQAIRERHAGRTRSLNEREALALVGEWYQWLTGQHEDNPGLPKRWSSLRDALSDQLERDEGEFNEGVWIPAPEAIERLRPAVARETGADRFLTDKGLALTPEAYALFMDRVTDEFF